MSICRVVFTSTAVRTAAEASFAEASKAIAAENKVSDITGLLLFNGRNFLEVMEGEEQIVRARYECIKTDPRHAGVVTISIDETDGRAFDTWTVAILQNTSDAHGVDELLTCRVPTDVRNILMQFARLGF
jgi:Sensors of blue-light using FAD